MLSFHRVMTIVYLSSTYLQLWNLRISEYTYAEIQALWLVEKTITRLFFTMAGWAVWYQKCSSL